MNLLVVGGAGYIGSHFVRYLQEGTNWQPVVLDNLCRGHRQAVGDVPFITGNFGDAAGVRSICSRYAIEAVVHFGAFAYVGESVINPRLYYENNLVCTKGLLDGMLDAGVRCFLFSSTCSTYSPSALIPIREDSPQLPINPYGRTKLAVEGMLASYAEGYGLRFASLRYFNAAGAHPSGAIGEDHRPETHLIPLILQVALGQRDAITVLGADYPTEDGTCVRDYIHVCDLARAHHLALQYLLDGGPSVSCNLGTGTGSSVLEIIEACRKITGSAIPHTIAERRPGDPAVLVACSERAEALLHWQPQLMDIRDIISTAWRWHLAHPLGYTD